MRADTEPGPGHAGSVVRGHRCLFCDLIEQRKPASWLLDEPLVVAFLDIYPVAEGHALVTLRRHAARLEDLTPEEHAAMMRAVVRVQKAQQAVGLRAAAHTVWVNDGPGSGQHVPHVHIHVVPRHKMDRLQLLGRYGSAILNKLGATGRRANLDNLARRLRASLAPDR